MLPDCLKCRYKIDSKNSKIVKTKNGKIILLSNCAVCCSKKLRFVKEHETSGIVSSLSKSLNTIPLVGCILF